MNVCLEYTTHVRPLCISAVPLTFQLDEPHILLYAVHLVDPQGRQLMTGRRPAGTHTRILTVQRSVIGGRKKTKSGQREREKVGTRGQGITLFSLFLLPLGLYRCVCTHYHTARKQAKKFLLQGDVTHKHSALMGQRGGGCCWPR